MRIRTLRFETRLSDNDRTNLDELAALLDVDRAEAIRLSVAEKLHRVRAKRAKQKVQAPADTEAA